MKTRSQTFVVILIGVIFTLLPSAASAQYVHDGNKTGLPPFGNFHGSNFDVVSLSNGNLHIEIPLVSLPQRNGRTFSRRYVYDIPTWEIIWYPPPDPQSQGFWVVQPAIEQSGWRGVDPLSWSLGFVPVEEQCPSWPYQTVWLQTNFAVWAPDGTKHPLPLRKENQTQGCFGSTTKGPTLDGSGILADISSGDWSTAKIILKDGTQVWPFLTSGPLWRDSNGNLASTSADMLLRDLEAPKDSSGNPVNFTVQMTTVTVQTSACSEMPGICYEYTANRQVPSTLTLPNGKQYVFHWAPDGFRDLTRIDLPTGGWIEYTYATTWYDSPDGGRYAPVTARRSVTSRRVNDGSITRTWTYSYDGGWTTVTDPVQTQQNQEVHEHQHLNINGVWSDSWMETRVRIYQGTATSGTLLRTITKDYAGELNPLTSKLANIRVIRETTALENSLVLKSESDYETFTYTYTGEGGCPGTTCTATRLNVIERREFGYGSGAPGGLARRTANTYLHTGNQTYLDRNIVDRVASTQVFSGGAALAAWTTFEYDNYTQGIQATGAVQHDPDYGAGFFTRGNVTAVSRWRNTDGVWLTSRNQYDDVGNVISATDPGNHTTVFDYTDSWTQGTCAPGGPGRAYLRRGTNPLGHQTNYSYYSCTGLAATTTDPNGQTTTQTYDLLSRPKETIYPLGGGQTTNNYNEEVPPFSVTTTKQIDATQDLVSTAVYDGLGRVKQTQLNSDPQGTVYTDTTYDELGRKKTVSNPYRSTSESTYGITTFEYDALGRVKKVIPPDGTSGSNYVLTEYCGNATKVTDQAGKWRRSVTEALGRLVEVHEPNSPSATVGPCVQPGDPVAVTGYTYDTLDNLISALQSGSRQRTFSYNSLSQLLSATNPESGTINYAYDADGNLITKDAPRPNQPEPAVRAVTTYQYDALHRLTRKTYTDGTPQADFAYDSAWIFGLNTQNAVGRLIWAGTSNTGTVFSYDVNGRINTQWQCTPYNCGWGWWRQDYIWNPGSLLAWYTNAMGFTIWQSFNGAGQVTQVTSSLNDAQHPGTLAHTIYYTPAGAQNRITFGNGLVELRWFNNRQQPWQLHTFNPPYTGTDVLRLDYDYAHGVANNGNVQSWEAHGQQTFTRNFIYDELNRVKMMGGTGGSCTGLEWTYDIWGNRTNQSTAQGGGSCPEHHPVILTNNRISGLGYDAAGNVTFDPASNATYTYDAENRMISSVSTLGNASYVYDANGQRVRKTVGGTVTDFLYNLEGKVAAEANGSGSWQVGYVYLNGQMLAQYKDNTTYFAHSDHLGSTRLLTAAGGQIAEGYDYLPFGEQLSVLPLLPVVNPSFENGTAGWAAGYWGATAFATNTTGYTGSWSLAHTGGTEGGSFQDVGGLIAGRTYRVSVWVRAEAGTTAKVNLWVHDTTGSYQGNNYGATAPFTPGAGWQQISLEYTADSTGMVRIHLHYTPGAGTIYHDEVRVELLGGGSTTMHKFTGKERDAESGLDFFLARYYSSTQGRFLSPDEFTGGPIEAYSASDPLPPGPLPYAVISNPQSLNKYAYTYNNPLRYVDPDGHDLKDFLLGFGNAVASNFFLGQGRAESYNSDHASGQAIGDAVSVVGGVVEVAVGGAAVVGGSGEALVTAPAAATGLGALVPAAGAATALAGVAIVTHGAVMAGTALSNIVNRKSSQQHRNEWEGAHGKPWPKDAETGGNQQVHHKKARADGGSDNVRNIEPMPRKKHIEHHKSLGDFRRWGKRAGKEKKKDAQQEH